MINNTRCQRCAERIGWVSLLANLLMTVLKICVGMTSGSKACIADGLHSASNVVVAFAIIMSQKISCRDKTCEFPYGYGKTESLFTAFISFFIISGAVTLLVLSIQHLMRVTNVHPPHMSAALMALVSIGVSEMLFRYMRCAGSHLNSQVILAGAWANRADCFSSVTVLIGVCAAELGFHYLDPISAIVVVAIIINACYKMLIDSVRALMDYSVNDRYEDEIDEIVSGMRDIQSEVRGVNHIRTRQIGRKVWVELDILVDPLCSIQDAQLAGEKVRKRLLEKITDFESVLINFIPLENEEC